MKGFPGRPGPQGPEGPEGIPGSKGLPVCGHLLRVIVQLRISFILGGNSRDKKERQEGKEHQVPKEYL